ncbi:TetR/AcrR family transcriptional regulator [Streptomyces sp. Act143]|uniref:TetR/AcrR family transcriptional regulator n=1 Tax=Streptomyces sp. Act143 TaxID=2200760 RepID=UPI000D67E613|nr:TetR/AcrR family transcriptional regulator [Streptomyces sp. Act143]PWI15773.1 TetR/AcrR family transcriptional regulator [Streptomyces sp. Act143]
MTGQDRGVRPLRRDAVRNQRQIVDAARQVVSEAGTDASMELIASRAGVGVGTVYRHFPGKQALVDELIRLIHDEHIDAARRALARGDGTGLEEFLRALGGSLSEHRGYGNQLISRTSASHADRLRELVAELLAQAQEHRRVRPDITLGDVMTTVWAIRGIITTSGSAAPHAWARHLDIQLAGMRSTTRPSDRPEVTVQELMRISGANRDPDT